MTSTQLTVDDGDSFVYTSGDWHPNNHSIAFDYTRSLTRTPGAYKVVRFIGTTITVFGDLYPISPDKPGTVPTTLITAHFSIDNGQPTVYKPNLPTAEYLRVSYYQSPILTNGEHILMLMNAEHSDFFWLDYFVIQGPQPRLLPSDGARIPSGGSYVSAQQGVVGAPSSNTIVNLVGLTTVTVNNTPVGVSASLPPAITSTQDVNQAFNGSMSSHLTTPPPSSSKIIDTLGAVTTYQPTVIISQDTSKEHSSTPIIIGAVLGTLFFVLIVAAIITVIYRRERRQSGQVPDETHQFQSTIEPINHSFPPLSSMNSRSSSPSRFIRTSRRVPIMSRLSLAHTDMMSLSRSQSNMKPLAPDSASLLSP